MILTDYLSTYLSVHSSHAYYIIFGRPPIGGNFPLSPSGGATALWPCLSVSVSVLLKWLDGSSWFLARRLLSTSPTLCFNEIQLILLERDLSA